jgi:hypothetical protein
MRTDGFFMYLQDVYTLHNVHTFGPLIPEPIIHNVLIYVCLLKDPVIELIPILPYCKAARQLAYNCRPDYVIKKLFFFLSRIYNE